MYDLYIYIMKYHPRLWNLFRREQGWIPHHHQSCHMPHKQTNQKTKVDRKKTLFFVYFLCTE